jgi:hypothetical protein
MAAMLLAGGSIAACGSTGAPDGGVATEPQSQERIDASKMDATAPGPIGRARELLRISPEPRPHRPHVPVCNANPDPYCRVNEGTE